MRRPVIFCSSSLSPGSQLNTRPSYTIQAAWLRVGGSGLQTMSNILEQSFCTIVTSTRVPKWKANFTFDTFANLHMNVVIFQDKLKAFYQIKYLMWPYRMYCTISVNCVFYSRCKSNLHFDFEVGLALIWSTFHLSFFLFYLVNVVISFEKSALSPISWNVNSSTFGLQLYLRWWYYCHWMHKMLCDVKIAAASEKGQMMGYHGYPFQLRLFASSELCPHSDGWI